MTIDVSSTTKKSIKNLKKRARVAQGARLHDSIEPDPEDSFKARDLLW